MPGYQVSQVNTDTTTIKCDLGYIFYFYVFFSFFLFGIFVTVQPTLQCGMFMYAAVIALNSFHFATAKLNCLCASLLATFIFYTMNSKQMIHYDLNAYTLGNKKKTTTFGWRLFRVFFSFRFLMHVDVSSRMR